MKPFVYLFFVLLINCFFSSAQNENILLRPENGKEYFYRFTDSEYVANKEGEKFSELRKQKTLHIKFSNVEPENKELLQVKVIQNKAEKPLSKPIEYNDYMYPYFEGAYFGNRYDNFYEELLCDIEFQYEFDDVTSQVKLYNRPDVLLKVRETLKRKEFDEKGIERYTAEFNEKGIPEITKRLNSIYRISKDFEKDISDKEKYEVVRHETDSLLSVSAKRKVQQSGLNSFVIKTNNVEHYLRKYYLAIIDSSGQNKWPLIHGNQLFREEEICLLRKKDLGANSFTVTGSIENTKFKKVTLATLRNSFGSDFNQESVFLDENNNFVMNVELNHPGIVLLQLGQSNQSRNLPVLMVYAEPGSQINLKIDGETFPGEVHFSGDFCRASEMLYEFQENFYQNTNLETESMFWSSRMKYSLLQNTLDGFDLLLKKYENRVDENAFEFIEKELKAKILGGVLFNLEIAKREENKQIASYLFPDQEKIDVDRLEDFLAKNRVLDNYNDYGIYSRLLAKSYLSYSSFNAIQIEKFFNFSIDIGYRTSAYWYNFSFPLSIEFSKTFLGGHAFYSCIADILQSQTSDLKQDGSRNALYNGQKVDDYSDLMLRLCNNHEFTDEFKSLLFSYKKWEDAKYIPMLKFLDQEGKESYLKDFIGEKPVVFYVANNWGAERYYFDDLAKENPDINFVMVTEGNNFQEWKDYMERAEPVAYQLFLANPENHLNAIFRRAYRNYIVYDKNGVRFAFATNPLDAKNYAKQSLETPQKKELNKSQLQLIILVLLVILTTFIISIISWKWRVRQRFRKEALARKLKESELTAIRSQMNPHFLFNSLNSVQNLVQQNKGREAHLYLSDFAGLIRKVLNNSEKEEVSLAEELEMIRQYLNLEKLRFDFEFEIVVDAGIDQYNTMVPSILLQPFVENAVIHGLQNKADNRLLKVEVSKELSTRLAVPNRLAHNSGTVIKITIEDNGIGREAAKEISKQKNGKGTKLMKERLEILRERQGESYSISTYDLKEGTLVEIILPEEN